MIDDAHRRAWRQDVAALAGALVLLLLWDFAKLDLPVMQRLGTANGFPLRDMFFTRDVLHEGGRGVAYALMAYAIACQFKPFGPLARCMLRERRWCLATIVVALVTIPLLKQASLTSCPWSLQAFGGAARYVSHWAWGVRDGGGGGCFPSGHASSAFAFLPIAWALRAHDRRAARRWLVGLVAFGAVIGAGQTLRGAHYPSHTLWTAWICAAITVASWHLFARATTPSGASRPTTPTGVSLPAAPVDESPPRLSAEASRSTATAPRQNNVP